MKHFRSRLSKVCLALLALLLVLSSCSALLLYPHPISAQGLIVKVDNSNAPEVIEGSFITGAESYSGDLDDVLLVIENQKDFWVNLEVNAIGMDVPDTSDPFAMLGLLAPRSHAIFYASFDREHESVLFFADMTVESG